MKRKSLIPKELEVINKEDIFKIIMKKFPDVTKKDLEVGHKLLIRGLKELVKEGKPLVIDNKYLGRFMYSERMAINNPANSKRYIDDMAKKIYAEQPDGCMTSVHHAVEPIHIAQGLHNNNMIRVYEQGSIVNDKKYAFKTRFTPRELEYYQNRNFFKEDVDFRDREDKKDLIDAIVKKVDPNNLGEVVEQKDSHGEVPNL